jgi:hypothetical protein
MTDFVHPSVPTGPDGFPDEDTFTIPSIWRRTLHPRRGGAPGPALTTKRDPVEAARDLVKRLRDLACVPLNDANSDQQLADLGRAHLEGENPTPEAAAAGAAVLTSALDWGDEQAGAVLVDAWVRKQGVVHAARVIAELGGIFVGASTGSVSPGALGIRIRRIAADEDQVVLKNRWLPMVYRMRAHLAAASDDEYERARQDVAEYRARTARQSMVATYLFPDQIAWVDEECARVASTSGFRVSPLLLCSVTTVGQLDLIADRIEPWLTSYEPGTAATVAEGVGPAAAPTLARWFDAESDTKAKKRLLDVLSWLPTDQAFELLIGRLDQKYVPVAALEAAARYPVRALRLLDAAAEGRSATAGLAADLLRGHVLGHPELVATAPASLRKRAEAIAASASAIPHASPDELPRLVVNPPWTVNRAAADPMVVDGLVPTFDARMAWADGEREAWTVEWTSHREGWEGWAKDFANGREQEGWQALARAPEDLVRPLLSTWRPTQMYNADYWLRAVVARFGLDAVPLAVLAARGLPAACGPALLPLGHPEVATLMADWLVRLKSARVTALAWLGRHPRCAAAALIPGALGKPGKDRDAAEAALRAVAVAGHADTIRVAADAYGPDARTGIGQLLDVDPLDLLPARMPVVPEWVGAVHGPVLLRDRQRALPDESVRHIATMLALSKPDDVYAGVEIVKQVCDPDSLAEFAWSLFTGWQADGLPSKEGWVLDALGLIGNDETVRRLTPLIHAWPGEGGHARAVTGLAVLAAIGTDVALMHLHGIAQKAKFKGLKERAGEKIAEVAQRLGLSAEQLADRLVPDLGLDPEGSTTLDYGPRQFVVGFDEQLKPYVADPDGKRRKDLPKPGAKDDTAKAEDAYKRFTALKKDVRTIAADQIRRLENAMVWQRRWTGAEFRDLLVAHPLLWHLVRRLVWGTYDKGELVTALRVAEDRTFADVNDNTVHLDPAGTIGITHPLDLADTVAAWSALFADYEILQPFPQLGRDTHRVTDEERTATRLTRYEGLTVPIGQVLGLERRGWVRGEPQDAGMQGWIFRLLPGGRAVVINLDPGIPIGRPTDFGEQTLKAVWLNDRPEGDWRPTDRVRLGDLDPVTVSEILRDLIELKG